MTKAILGLNAPIAVHELLDQFPDLGLEFFNGKLLRLTSEMGSKHPDQLVLVENLDNLADGFDIIPINQPGTH
jgi:hypothetical protein